MHGETLKFTFYVVCTV